MVWPCKQNASGKLPKQALLVKVKGKRPVGSGVTRGLSGGGQAWLRGPLTVAQV